MCNMAKSPAVLFYTGDFLNGTITMTDEEVGKYIRLLCLQHQQGHITDKHMKKICNSNDDEVLNKFVKDENGNWYNERMRDEILKRENFCNSRSINREGKKKDKNHIKNICNTYEKHMENENENRNTIDRVINKEEKRKLDLNKPKPKKSTSDLIKEKQDTLYTSIKEFIAANPGKYPKSLYNDFYNYWSEPYKNPTANNHIKLDENKTWSLSGRLSTWFKRGAVRYEADLLSEKKGYVPSANADLPKEEAEKTLKIFLND